MLPKIFVVIALVSAVAVPMCAVAGTSGILEGTVSDKRTGEPLPGVNIVLTEIRAGSSTGAQGRYEVQNVRAGTYTVRFSHIGYQTFVIKNVVINADLRTRLNASLEPSDVALDEVIVVQDKPLIQRDITGTTYIVSAQDITLLPIDRPTDVIRLKPGVTSEGNIRGGKSTEVQYLIDGLPAQDVLAGGFGADLPNSSIVGLTMYTGGFEAEYGNALSGVVNIVTRTGSDSPAFYGRASNDNLFGGTQTSKATSFEASASGPVRERTMYYMVSMNGLLTGTRWWQDFQTYFPLPVDKTVNGLGKVDYEFSPTMRLGGQLLFSKHDWRDYEFGWRFNLPGLPPESKTSYRLAAIFSHSITQDFFYTASLSRLFMHSTLGEGSKADVLQSRAYEYDFFYRYIEAGQRAWWSDTRQENYTTRIDGTWKAGQDHLLKFGGELTLYNLTSDVVKLEPRKTFFGKPLVNEPQLNFSSAYAYRPRSGSVYFQDKFDVPSEGLLLNAGLRYDFMDPRAERPNVEAIPVADTAYTFSVRQTVPARVKQQLSPRLGMALQVAERGYLFVNLGWYFQYPLFDYLYSGLDRVGLAKGISALNGNPDLEPERTQMWEISLKYTFVQNLVGSITYFRKETSNQIDTKTFIPGDSKVAGNFGFAEYVNTPYAEASGFELVLSRDRGSWVTGEISYTYMTAEGTSGSASDGFYIAQYGLPPSTRLYPLSWDQRHTFKGLVTVHPGWGLGISLVGDWHSGRPYTRYPTSTGFEKIVGGLFSENNARMPDYGNLDVRAEKELTFDWWRGATVTVYVDSRNVLNARNVRWVDSNGKVGGEMGDPSAYFDPRRTYAGIQVAF